MVRRPIHSPSPLPVYLLKKTVLPGDSAELKMPESRCVVCPAVSAHDVSNVKNGGGSGLQYLLPRWNDSQRVCNSFPESTCDAGGEPLPSPLTRSIHAPRAALVAGAYTDLGNLVSCRHELCRFGRIKA